MYLLPNNRCYVYWIHLIHHTNYLTEGYIGVSIDPNRRFNEHRDINKSPVVAKQIIIHDQTDIIYDILYCGDEDSCYDLELEWRPTGRIGWNIAAGGARTLSTALRGIKKSTTVWNKNVPQTESSKLKFRNTWIKKIEDGYSSPNKINSIGNTNRRGKNGPPMPLSTRTALLKANTGGRRENGGFYCS